VKSHATARFWQFYDKLSEDVRRDADRAYKLWQDDPRHPSLQFKRVDPQDPIYSVRVGRGYRALGWLEGDAIAWFWIGAHDEYDRMLKGK
jgi:hypothetical protein